MRLVLSRQARVDLAAIKRYIAQDNPRAAAVLLARFDDVLQ